MSQTRPRAGILGGGSSRGESESESGADHFDAALKALHECQVMDRVHVERAAAHTEGDHPRERANSLMSSTASAATVGLLSSGSLISVMPTPSSPRDFDEIPPPLESRPRYAQNEASPRLPPPYNPFVELAGGVAQQSQDDGSDGRTDGASARPSYNPFIELADGVAHQSQDAGSDDRTDGASARPLSAPARPAPASGTGTAALLPQRRHSPAAGSLPAASVATAAAGTVPETAPVAPLSPPALPPVTLPPPPPVTLPPPSPALNSPTFQSPPPALRPWGIPPPSAGVRPATLPGSTAARCRPIGLAVENAQGLTPTQTATPWPAAVVADDLTPEQAQAIIDAAEMEEALAVVRAAEAAENAAQVAAGESMAATIQAEEQRAAGNGRTGGTSTSPSWFIPAIPRALNLAADEAMAAALHAEEVAGASTSSLSGRGGSGNASAVAPRASVPDGSGTGVLGRLFNPEFSSTDQRHGNSRDNSNAARPLESPLPRWWQSSVSSPRSIRHEEAAVRAREEAEDAAAIAALCSDGEYEDCRQVEVDGATQAGAEAFKQALALTTTVSSTTPVQLEQRGSRGSGIPRCSECQSRISGISDVSMCRNCCMLVCDQCVGALWARNMVPIKNAHKSNSHRMRVCRSCHNAMEAFRKALLLGKEEDAAKAYKTGFVNLNTPYTIYHGEWPVHCAAAGGEVKLLSWLVDDLGCNLFSDALKKTPLRDQRQLTVLGAAAVNGQVQTMRYLVGKGCCVSEIKHPPTLKRALKACLLGATEVAGPVERAGDDGDGNPGGVHGGRVLGSGVVPVDDDSDLCIVCFDNGRDCTLVPCGHHCACLSCAARFNECPICRAPVRQKIKTINV